MTAVLNKQPDVAVTPWSIMPGWGVVADLTPPELVQMRRMKVLRKVIAGGLIALLLALVAVYVLATMKASAAEDKLAATHRDGDRLSSQTNQYSAVTRLQNDTANINTQISGLMSTDVDVAGLMATVTGTLPGSMSITSMNVSLTSTDGAAQVPTTTSGPSIEGVIGTVTMTGQSQNLADLADYTAKLLVLKGITAVLPTSNTAGAAGTANWSLTFSLTDALHTHKYDAKPSGGN